MKILIIVSTLDLTKPFGATPALWQLFKAFYEIGHELIIIPYHGRSIQSLWWRSMQNPNYYKGLLLEKILKTFRSHSGGSRSTIIPRIARVLAKPQLVKTVQQILLSEGNVDALMLIGIPINQLSHLARDIQRDKMPVILYDLDVPTSLPSSGGFTFNHFVGADLSEYNLVIIPSEGSVNELKELGAQSVEVVHFGVDPDVYLPMDLEKDIDLFFFGNGGLARKKNIQMMITIPSRILNYKFVVSGRDLSLDLGNASHIPPLNFVKWREFACRSKVNLNVVRELHASVAGTSTSRPFELAAMKCCIVSSPYNGLDKWFEIGKEILIGQSQKEFVEIYNILLTDDSLREKMGHLARERILKEHTSRHRAFQITNLIKNL